MAHRQGGRVRGAPRFVRGHPSDAISEAEQGQMIDRLVQKLIARPLGQAQFGTATTLEEELRHGSALFKMLRLWRESPA